MERFTDDSQAPYVTAGLSQYGADYYAVLGVPLGAAQEQIRQGYLRAARLLHPDRYVGNEGGKQEAGKLFSALVTPAYDNLNRQNRRQEYDMMTRLLAARLASTATALAESPLVRSLANCRTADALQKAYHSAVESLSEGQYREIARTLSVTNDLSQLNLAYLLLSQKLGEVKSVPAVTAPAPAASAATAEPAAPAAEPARATVNWSVRHFERGQDFLKRKQYREAVQSFRESLRLDPNNANVLAHLGIAFLRQGLPGMAKAEFQKALAIDPKNELATKFMRDGAAPAEGSRNGKGAGATKGTQGTKGARGAKDAKEPNGDKGLFQKLWNQLNKPL